MAPEEENCETHLRLTIMTTYTDISIYIRRNGEVSPEAFLEVLGPLAVYYSVCRRRWNRPSLEELKNLSWVSPRWFCDEDHSRATILFLKVYVAWNNGDMHRYNLDPWNLVVFPAKSSIPLNDDVKLTDISSGFYGPNSRECPLVIVHKDKPSSPMFSISRIFGRRKKEHRVIEQSDVS